MIPDDPQHQPEVAPGQTPSVTLRRRLAGGGAWGLAGRIIVAFATLSMNAIVTRLLVPADAGTFFLATSLVLGIGIVGQFGLHRVAVRMVADSEATGTHGRTRVVIEIVMRLSLVIALFIAVIFALPPVHSLLRTMFPATGIADVAFLIGLAIALRSMSLVHAETFRGFHEVGKATFFGGVDAHLLFVAALGAMWYYARDAADLPGIIALNALVWVPGVCVSALLLMRRAARLQGPGDATTREVLAIAGPIVVVGIGHLAIGQADLWVVGARLHADDLARYGAALRLFTVISIPLQIVNTVVPPMIVELKALGQTARLQRLMRATATAAAAPSFIVLVLFVGLGSQVMGVFYGDFYRSAGTVLAILSVSNMVSVWTGSCGMALVMTGHERVMMYITSVCAALLVIGAIVGSYWGLTGVAVASTVVLSAQNVAAWLAAKRLLGVYTHAGLAPGIDAVRAVIRK